MKPEIKRYGQTCKTIAVLKYGSIRAKIILYDA